MRLKAILITALLCAVVQGAWAWDGSGTSTDPYLIKSSDDWQQLATDVSGGNSYSGKVFRMTVDIDADGVSVGAEGKPFSGIFDGNGKTLNVNISETTTNGTAPFRDIQGATIKNLTVEGTVTGRTHAAGLVGIVRAGGTTTISGCWVKTTVTSAGDGDKHIGGVVGHGTTATLTIENTVFSGDLNNSADYAGGFVGWSGNNTLTIKNSFFVGTHSGQGLFHPIAIHNWDCTTSFSDKGAYYLSTVIPSVAAQSDYIAGAGTAAYTTKPDEGTYLPVTAADGNQYYVAGITYIERSWDAVNKIVVSETQAKLLADIAPLSGNHPDDWIGIGDNDGENHYYKVSGDTNYKTINVFGRVHLILTDGATLTCTGGIKVEAKNNAKLFIYGQNSNTGRLIVTNSYTNTAGIGASVGEDSGELCIHGGSLDITGGKWGAGIGPGAIKRNVTNTTTTAGPVTIYGGTVKATGGENGAGIGGSSGNIENNQSNGGTVVIYGGTVEATGGDLAAGVGGGGSYIAFGLNYDYLGGNGGDVTVYGGSLTAQGGSRAAGIGSGNRGWRARKPVSGGSLTVYGGTVTATGGFNGAGIGGGHKVSGGTVNVQGGSVTATGGKEAAGIGGGYEAGGGATTISGGTVVVVAGEGCQCRNPYSGSAIGCGNSCDKGENSGNLVIVGMKVKAGDSKNDIERTFTSAERINACRWRNYVEIEACDHTAQNSDAANLVTTYTQNEGTHTAHCRYCEHTETTAHSFDTNNVCSVCGKEKDASDECTVTVYQATSAISSTAYDGGTVYKVLKNTPFSLSSSVAEDGLIFMGYLQDPATAPASWEMKDDDYNQLFDIGLGHRDITPTDNTVFYATYRYNYESTWTWADDYSSATLSITCAAISDTQTPAVTVTHTHTDATAEADGSNAYSASASYIRTPGVTYQFSHYLDFPIANNISLANNDDNSGTLSHYNGGTANTVTLNDRTLFKDGSWNTLCLPFSLSTDEVTAQLAPMELKTLSSSSFTGGTLTLNFTDATSIEAGKPYIIKWTGNTEWTNPSFSNVIIENVDKSVVTDYVTFAGSFSPVDLEAKDMTVLYLGAGNTLYWPNDAMTIGSCRAVFVLNGLTAGTPSADARAFVLNFGDESTGITTTNFTNDTNSDGAWYDMQGRRLSGRSTFGRLLPQGRKKPTQRGIYIINGKKIVIK